MKTIIWLLYWTVVIHSMLDFVQTKLLLDLGAKEINPVFNWLIEYTGTVYSMFYIKVGILSLLLVLLAIYFKGIQKEFEHVK